MYEVLPFLFTYSFIIFLQIFPYSEMADLDVYTIHNISHIVVVIIPISNLKIVFLINIIVVVTVVIFIIISA